MDPLHKKNGLKLIIYLFIFILLNKPFTAAGQAPADYHKIDSVIYQLGKKQPDSNRVRLLIELSADYLSKRELNPAEFDEVFKHLQHAATLCDSLGSGFAGWKVKCLHLMGNALILCNKVAAGKSIFMTLAKNAHDAGDRQKEAESWIGYAEALSNANKTSPFEQDAVTAYTNAITIYREMKNQKGDIDVTLLLAILYCHNNQLNKAEELFLVVLKKSETFGSYNLPLIYYWLSSTNRYMGNYNKALGYALHAIKAMEALKDYARESIYYGELAEVYQALDKPAESVIWYKKCINKREQQAGYSSFSLYRTYSLLVTQLIKSGAQKEALATIKDLKKRRPPNTIRESAVYFQSMAYCYDAANIYDSTEKYLLKTVETYNKANKKLVLDEEIVLLSYYDIANFYVRHQQFQKVHPYVDSLVSKARSVAVSKMAEVQLLLFKADSASGDYLAAIKHFQQYKTLTDSVFNEKKTRQIEELQIAYKTEKKDQEIGILIKKAQLQQANLKQANITRNWIAASTVLLILLLAAGYNRYRFKQRTNKKLEAQQIVINQKNISLQHLVNEKEWLMKEIHHRVKNNFHIVTGLLGTQSGYLKNEEAIVAIKESQQRIHAMSLIHQKLYQSENLSAIDMPGYIHELVDSLKDSFEKSVRVQFHFQLDRISLELSHVIPIGLILNEAITNVFKYAFPDKKEGNIYISFTKGSGNRMVLTVMDDGIGLPENFNSNPQSSMGLNLMKGLSEDIDGCFSIQRNNGTTVTVSFIYNPEIYFTPSITGQNFIA